MESITTTQGWLEALFLLWCLSMVGASLVSISLFLWCRESEPEEE